MPIRPENRGRYPANWASIAVGIKVNRAGGRCECTGQCGRGTHAGRCLNRHGEAPYDAPVLPQTLDGSEPQADRMVILTVAHLDHTPEHCHPDNLLAMCQGCHLHYDLDHHAETRALSLRAARAAAGQLTLETS